MRGGLDAADELTAAGLAVTTAERLLGLGPGTVRP
jgi:hypothetical protein